MKIGPYIHRCTEYALDMPDGVYNREVDAGDYLMEARCRYCGEPLVTTEQLLAHIYAELTET